MVYRLPPLNTLRFFEAAGRHLSFKRAAEELNVTPSAVSHGIQTLEDWLGAAMFARGNRSLVLTGAGAAYLPQVRTVLDLLARATEAVPGRRPNGRLTVSVAPSFGLRWLLPRLRRFRELHPEIEVSVDTTSMRVEFPRDGVDVAIRMGRGDWNDLYAKLLVAEHLVPVCSPVLAERLTTYEDLASATLLHVETVADDWQTWRSRANVEISQGRVLKFDTVNMAFEAAVQGLGVAMGRVPLVSSDIEAGRLVPLFGPPVPCTTGYWLVAGRESLARPEVVAFRKWISAELNDASVFGHDMRMKPRSEPLNPAQTG